MYILHPFKKQLHTYSTIYIIYIYIYICLLVAHVYTYTIYIYIHIHAWIYGWFVKYKLREIIWHQCRCVKQNLRSTYGPLFGNLMAYAHWAGSPATLRWLQERHCLCPNPHHLSQQVAWTSGFSSRQGSWSSPSVWCPPGVSNTYQNQKDTSWHSPLESEI